MNIIKEQIEYIILENNTAQEQLINYLEKTSHKTNSIEIREHLCGDLDFSILKEMGFITVNSIILEEGEITNIINIPETVKVLKCPKNLLTTLPILPSSLTHLEIPYNYVYNLNFSQVPELKYLNISFNLLKKLENIPKEIVEIHCQNNSLNYINLYGLNNLKVLNISNNNITITENLPKNLIDFKMDNTPSIEFRNSPSIPLFNNNKNIEILNQQTINYVDSIHEYFKLKQEYENDLYKMKKKVYSSVTNKKKAIKKTKMVKPKCINCKRPVGTIFSKKENRYIAICGDIGEPCNLNIEIFNGIYDYNRTLVDSTKKYIEDLKIDIIRHKLDTLFNYIDEKESIELFNDTMNLFNVDNAEYKYILDNYDENYNNKHKNEMIQDKKDKIFKLIENIRSLLDEYSKTENRELLKTAVELQIKDLLPETRNLAILENELMEMNEKVNSNNVVEHFLFKNKVALTKDVINLSENPRVIKFSTSG